MLVEVEQAIEALKVPLVQRAVEALLAELGQRDGSPARAR